MQPQTAASCFLRTVSLDAIGDVQAVMELKVLMELLPELRFHPKLRSAS